jgi:tetratricopeptide (TPR) repeat protein
VATLKWLWQAFTWIIDHAVAVTVLSLFVTLLGVIWRCVGDQPPILKPIAVPPSLAELGITPQVFTNMVEQRVAELKSLAAADDQPDLASLPQGNGQQQGQAGQDGNKKPPSKASQDQPLFEPQDEALAKLTLPGTEASLQVLVTIVNRLLGKVAPEVEIGVIEQHPESATGGDSVAYSYTIGIAGSSLSPNLVSSSFADEPAQSYPAASIREMTDAIAEQAFWLVDPVAFLHLDLRRADQSDKPLTFSPFASGKMPDEPWEKRSKYIATKKFLEGCAADGCRVARDRARALLLLAELARDLGDDWRVTAYIERARNVSAEDVGASALLTAAEASLRIGDPVRAEGWTRAVIEQTEAAAAAPLAGETEHADPLSDPFELVDLRQELADARQLLAISLFMQMRTDEAGKALEPLLRVRDDDDIGDYIDVDEERVEFYRRVSNEISRLVQDVKALRAAETDRALLEKDEKFNTAVDALGSLAVATGWPGAAASFKETMGSDFSPDSHAAAWSSLLSLEGTRNIETVQATVKRFEAIGAQHTISKEHLGVAELAIAARSILPEFRSEILATYQGIENRSRFRAFQSIQQIVETAEPSQQAYASSLALAALATASPSRKVLGPASLRKLYHPDISSSCRGVRLIARSGLDLIRFHSARNVFRQPDSDEDATPDFEPKDSDSDPRPIALEVLCMQFGETSDGFYVAARYLGAETRYAQALKSKDDRRALLLDALLDTGGPGTAEEALLRGKVLYQLERYTEAAEQLKDVKSVAGTVWMALTQVKLNDLEHAFANLASAIAYDPPPWDEGGASLPRAISEANGALRVMDEKRMQTLRDAMIWLESWGVDDSGTATQLTAIGERLSGALCDMGRYTEARSMLLHVTDATGNSAEAQKVLKKLKPCMAAAAPLSGVK